MGSVNPWNRPMGGAFRLTAAALFVASAVAALPAAVP
jgi:hypothetical protein